MYFTFLRLNYCLLFLITISFEVIVCKLFCSLVNWRLTLTIFLFVRYAECQSKYVGFVSFIIVTEGSCKKRHYNLKSQYLGLWTTSCTSAVKLKNVREQIGNRIKFIATCIQHTRDMLYVKDVRCSFYQFRSKIRIEIALTRAFRCVKPDGICNYLTLSQ